MRICEDLQRIRLELDVIRVPHPPGPVPCKWNYQNASSQSSQADKECVLEVERHESGCNGPKKVIRESIANTRGYLDLETILSSFLLNLEVRGFTSPTFDRGLGTPQEGEEITLQSRLRKSAYQFSVPRMCAADRVETLLSTKARIRSTSV